MSTELVLALIASGTSLVVAIISLLASVLNSRQTTRSSQKLESLKNAFSRQNSREELGDLHLNESLKSLQVAIQSIQRFKDELQVILSAVDSSLDSETAISHISFARQEVFAAYEDNLANFSEPEAKIFHQAKNRVLIIESLLRERLQQISHTSGLSDEDQRRFWEHRSLLTDTQQLLRDSKTDRLTKRMGRV